MKKRLALCMALAIALSSLAGCGSGQATESTASGSSGTTGGKTDLVVALQTDIATLNSAEFSTSSESIIGNQIYEGLMCVDGDTLKPQLAESWEISEDGLSYTFHLRQDVTFHDGSPVTAEDVKFSTELYQDSPYQGSVTEGLESIEIVDEHTVVMRTSTVFSPFLENIATMFVMSKNYYETAGPEQFASQPIGFGPYQFVSRDIGSRIVLKAYDGYYGGPASIKDVVFRIIPDDTTISMSLQTGELGFAPISENSYSTLNGYSGITIQQVPMSRFGFISLNHEKEPYSDVRFRQAVSYAIDRENLVNLALNGIGTPNSNIISPLRFGWSEDQPTYEYNPERAKELLAEMGLQTPYDLGIMPISEQFRTQAEVIQNDLKNIGLNVTLEIQEQNALMASMQNGDVGITVMEMGLTGVTQSYAMALTTPYIGMANNVRYSNPEIDGLFQKAAETIDEDARFQVYNEIFTKVQEEAVFVTLYNTEGLYAYSDQLNVPELPLEGTFKIYDFSWK